MSHRSFEFRIRYPFNFEASFLYMGLRIGRGEDEGDKGEKEEGLK